MQSADIEYPSGTGIIIRPVGTAWQVIIPAKRKVNSRIRKQCYTLQEAKEWASKHLEHVAYRTATLSDKDRAVAMTAFIMARKSGQCLTTLVANAIEAVTLLKDASKLLEAAKHYQETKGKMTEKSVLDAVEDMLVARKNNGASALHLKDLRVRLSRLTNEFGTMTARDLTSILIDEWLSKLDVGARSRVNYRRVTLAFVHFCEKKGYLARNVIVAGDIAKPKVANVGTIAVFSPEQLCLLLTHSSDQFRPYFILGALCGLRTAETSRLDWSAVDFVRRTVTIDVSVAKTASRRIIPMCDAAREWLFPLRKTSGKILVCPDIARETVRVLNSIEGSGEGSFRWKNNVLRHSFVSYRMAIVGDSGKVANEAGNSAKMVYQHYRELVADEAAVAWFNVKPATPAANIVALGDGS